MTGHGNPHTLCLFLLLVCIAFLFIACEVEDDSEDGKDNVENDDDDDNDDNDSDLPADEDNRENDPTILVVTTYEMAEAWQKYADWKDRTGLRTDVVFIEDIVKKDEPGSFALRAYLYDAHQKGVKYVLLGGDADQLPYVYSFTQVWALEMYQGNAPVSLFYEDLDTNWDADFDGRVGEEDEDIMVEDLRNPEIAIGRVPVETHEEALGFVNKVLVFESGDGSVADRAIAPLFLADEAMYIEGIGSIDGGMTHEQLIADYIPENLQDHARRLYGTEYYAQLVGAEFGTTGKVVGALENEGYTLVFANTHGSNYVLTETLEKPTVIALENEVPFVMLTTSCMSGNFTGVDHWDPAWDDMPSPNSLDTVAEKLLLNPNGGAVGFLGNTLYGLGPMGAVQFIHSMARGLFIEGDELLGDALLTARRSLWSEVAYVKIGEITIEFHLDMQLMPGVEWFTQRSAILLGDPALRMWTEMPDALTLDAPDQLNSGYNEFEIEVTKAGVPANGISVTVDQQGGVLVAKNTDSEGKAMFRVILESSDNVTITAYARNTVTDSAEYKVK